MITPGKSLSWMVGLPHSTAPCPILVMPNTRLGNDKVSISKSLVWRQPGLEPTMFGFPDLPERDMGTLSTWPFCLVANWLLGLAFITFWKRALDIYIHVVYVDCNISYMCISYVFISSIRMITWVKYLQTVYGDCNASFTHCLRGATSDMTPGVAMT